MSQGQKISQYGADQSPVTTDYVLGNKASGPSTATFKLSDLITLFAANFANSSLNTKMLYNPYKFSAYRSTSLSMTNGSVIVCDTTLYDTGSNYSNSTGNFTAPVAGFYHFDAQITIQSVTSSQYAWASLYKNGVELKRGLRISGNGQEWGTNVSDNVQLAASDTISVAYAGQSTQSAETGHQTGISGFLISLT